MDNKKKGTTKDEELALVNFLLENLSVFAWKISDMPGIPREVNEHKLEIDPSIKPIMQKEKKIHSRETRIHLARSESFTRS
jgi:hypothetical protein